MKNLFWQTLGSNCDTYVIFEALQWNEMEEKNEEKGNIIFYKVQARGKDRFFQ